MAGLRGSDCVVTAWADESLIGLGNAISDGALVVYYPHLCVGPEWQGKGVGAAIVKRLREQYQDFHQHSLIADSGAVRFYEKNGFEKAGDCEAMWIYDGDDH